MKVIKIFLCCVMAVLVGTAVGIIIFNIIRKNTSDKNISGKNNMGVEVSSQESITTEGNPDVQDTTEKELVEITTELQLPRDEEQPEELSTALLKEKITYKELFDMGCRQLVVVRSSGNSSEICVYGCDEKGAWFSSDLDCAGYVGSNGVSKESYEGSKMTPGGLFPIRDAFYIEEKPTTGLNTFQVDENTYWVDDSDSPHYNQRVQLEAGDKKDFNSAEHMIGYYDAYIYGFVIGFNDNPVIPGKGSAIFFHVGNCPTLGCVSTSREHVLDILAFLDAKKNPYILIQ